MDVDFIKSPQGLTPADDACRAWFQKVKSGEHVHGKMARRRNAKFHRKYFALLTYAFDVWKENLAARNAFQIYKGVPVMPDFDRFRGDIAVFSGFFTPVYKLNGDLVLKPKSISFANMSEDEFERLYSKTIDVLLEKVAGMEGSPDEVKRIVDNLVMFD